MANRTVRGAQWYHGSNPQYLIEKIIRLRIYDSLYWKEECFALTAENVADKAMELKYIGGTYGGNVKPAPFMCLILKMLQIQPDKDIIIEFIKNDDFRYVRALGAFYLRLTSSPLDCYRYLEPLYNDYRKMAKLNTEGKFEVVHMDEFIDELLHAERYLEIILPRLTKRWILESTNELEPRVSVLEEDLDQLAVELSRKAVEDEDADAVKTSDSKRSDDSPRNGRSTKRRSSSPANNHRRDQKQQHKRRSSSSDDGDADTRHRSRTPPRSMLHRSRNAPAETAHDRRDVKETSRSKDNHGKRSGGRRAARNSSSSSGDSDNVRRK